MQLKIHPGGYNTTVKLLTTLKVGTCKKSFQIIRKSVIYNFVQ